jgi:hypothetical protein
MKATMGGHQMIRRSRVAFLATLSALSLGALAAPAANANLLSILPGTCGNQPESQPFAQFGDNASYTLVPGGNFESGGTPWALTGAAHVASGNETYYVGGTADSRSLSLPAGSSATSPFSCTDIYHPTVRLFVRNTGASSSHLIVQAIYPSLLGKATTTLGEITGTSRWAPTAADSLFLNNLLATISLSQTSIAFRFVPADSTGNWSIDDVYLDPYARG